MQHITLITGYPCQSLISCPISNAHFIADVLTEQRKINIVVSKEKTVVTIPDLGEATFHGESVNRAASVVDYCQKNGKWYVENALIQFTENI